MHTYLLQDSVEIYHENKQNIHFLLANNNRHTTFEYDEIFIELLSHLENESTLDDLFRKLSVKAINLTKEELQYILDTLLEESIIKIKTINNVNTKYIPPRYSRQINFWDEFTIDDNLSGNEIQEKIQNSNVTVLGLGGVGSWICNSLVMAGVKNLTLVDGDCVEESNLTRQNLYNISDIGELKIDVMQKKLSLLEPDINIETYNLFIDENTVLTSLFKDSNIIISCIDYPSITQTGEWVSREASKLGIPHIISGGYNGHQGFIGPTIIPGKTTCWSCIVKQIEKEYAEWKTIREAKKIGTIGVLSSIVANLQAWEAIKILAGVKDTIMQNRRGEFDLMNFELKLFSYASIKNCEKCNDTYSERLTDIGQ